MARVFCDCMEPQELPGLMCGNCHNRRLGDDLTPEQTETLGAMIAGAFVAGHEDERVSPLRRFHGRKRPGNVQFVGESHGS